MEQNPLIEKNPTPEEELKKIRDKIYLIEVKIKEKEKDLTNAGFFTLTGKIKKELVKLEDVRKYLESEEAKKTSEVSKKNPEMSVGLKQKNSVLNEQQKEPIIFTETLPNTSIEKEKEYQTKNSSDSYNENKVTLKMIQDTQNKVKREQEEQRNIAKKINDFIKNKEEKEREEETPKIKGLLNEHKKMMWEDLQNGEELNQSQIDELLAKDRGEKEKEKRMEDEKEREIRENEIIEERKEEQEVAQKETIQEAQETKEKLAEEIGEYNPELQHELNELDEITDYETRHAEETHRDNKDKEALEKRIQEILNLYEEKKNLILEKYGKKNKNQTINEEIKTEKEKFTNNLDFIQNLDTIDSSLKEKEIDVNLENKEENEPQTVKEEVNLEYPKKEEDTLEEKAKHDLQELDELVDYKIRHEEELHRNHKDDEVREHNIQTILDWYEIKKDLIIKKYNINYKKEEPENREESKKRFFSLDEKEENTYPKTEDTDEDLKNIVTNVLEEEFKDLEKTDPGKINIPEEHNKYIPQEVKEEEIVPKEPEKVVEKETESSETIEDLEKENEELEKMLNELLKTAEQLKKQIEELPDEKES